MDGVDIRELDMAQLHRKFALISQEPVICTAVRLYQIFRFRRGCRVCSRINNLVQFKLIKKVRKGFKIYILLLLPRVFDFFRR